ncbi:hypothetical protein [Trinickia fusca]|uniref:Uncharacterized protein n=1 Tax=Trinickia fusca TaxID=2419777 RepID=A0A494XBV3_9BURK|nr:hypothetical protein [Trinickia fusca]RKP48317.1 hypothetical protein D7S89_13445 [Trinickia fusca]
MLMRNRTQRHVQAIRHHADDRLLVLIEVGAHARCASAAHDVAVRIDAWRTIYEDELEVLAFVRGTAADDPAIERARSAAQRLHTVGVPVVLGVLPPEPAGTRAARRARFERWGWCDGEEPRLAAGSTAPVDVVLVRLDTIDEPGQASSIDTVATRLVVGCSPSGDAIDQTVLASQTAQDIECGVAHACGLLLAPSVDHTDEAFDDIHALLSLLASAVYRRRITFATRCFAPLRSAL